MKPILPLSPTPIWYRFCSVIIQHNRRREIFPPIPITNPDEKFPAVPAYDFLFCYVVEDSPGGPPRFLRLGQLHALRIEDEASVVAAIKVVARHGCRTLR